jgi:plastocyanin
VTTCTPVTHQRSYGRALAALGAGAVLVLGLGACGGDDGDDAADDTTPDATTSDTSQDTGAETGSAGGSAVAYEVTSFDYSDVSAPAGGVLEVANSSGGAHTFTADDGAFDVPVADGESVPVDVPAEPGEYPFHCDIHTSMAATLTVE